MIDRTNDIQLHTSTEATSEARRGRRAGWLTAAAAASLLVVTPAMAQMGSWGANRTAAPADGTQVHAPFGAGPGGGYGPMHGGYGGTWGGHAPMHEGYGAQPGRFGGMQPGGFGPMMGRGVGPSGDAFGPSAGPAARGGIAAPRAMLSGMLHRLPIDTTVTVALYAEDPAAGAAPVETLSAVVGETSEVTFGQELQAAGANAAFLTIDIGERTHRVDLTEAGPRSPLGFLARGGGPLEIGQTVRVSFYAAADDATPTTTLDFTYGEDSEVAFRQALQDAAADAEAAEIVLPAQTRTLDLSSLPGSGAAPDGSAPRMGWGSRR